MPSEMPGTPFCQGGDADFEGKNAAGPACAFSADVRRTSLGKLCASDHAMNAIDEMSALNRDLRKFFSMGMAQPTPVWQELESGSREVSAMKYTGMPWDVGAVCWLLSKQLTAVLGYDHYPQGHHERQSRNTGRSSAGCRSSKSPFQNESGQLRDDQGIHSLNAAARRWTG